MKKILVLLVCILLGNFAFAYSTHKLNNGQTVVIDEIHSNPIVTIDTWVKTGSINETDKNNGISHFLEHLFFKGTEKNPYGTFDRVLESKGAMNNAATSKDFTHYYITLPSKYFNLALEMHSDMLQNPSIPVSEFEKERKVVLEEISKDINSPTTKVYNNLVEMMYINHPYKRRVIGSVETVSNLSREEIFDYLHTYYAPSNMVTVVTGDVNTKDVLKKIKNEFGSKYKKTPQHKFAQEKQLPSYLKKIEYLPTQSGYMIVGFRGVKITDKDSYAFDSLSSPFGEGRSSVLYRNIKENKQLAFNIGSSNATFKDDGIFFISANFVPENYVKLEKNIFDEIEELQKTGVNEEQVKLAQNIIERDTYFSRESVSNIAQEIGYTFVTTGDTKFYETYLDNIKKVTVNDVNKVLKKYLGKDKSAVSIVLPEGTKEVEISHKKPVCEDIKLISSNSETEKYILSNGSTLLYTPNKYNDIIGISIIAKGGDFLEPYAGTASLTAGLMTKNTQNYNETQLANIMEDHGIKIVPHPGSDAFVISVLTTKNEYDKTLELLDEIVNRAVFNQTDIEKLKKETLYSIKSSRDIPIKKAIEEYNTMIYQGSVYSNSNKIHEKTIPQISRENILEYYDKIFAPENLVISINGNVDKDKTVEKMSKIFSKENGQKFEYSKYKIYPPKAKRVSVQTDKNTETDWIFLGWQTDGLTNQKDYAALSVMDSLLGSGMSSRLFVNLREKEGLAYQLGSSFNPKQLRGNFVVYIGTNPKTLEHSKKKLFEEINKLKTQKVSSEELQEAKDKLLGHYILGQETNLEKATLLGKLEATGRGYDFKNSYIELINQVTESDIMNVANKYFNDNYIMSVVKK